MKKILFTGGGSAGHVVPNLAVMRELRYLYALSYMGTGGIEKRLVTEAGYPFYEVETPKFRRSLCRENFRIPFDLHRAKKEALAALETLRPDLVFSKGGYASYPAVWAAHRLKIPVFTHESDLSPGLCTRLIAKKCVYVLTSFPETARRFPNGKCVGSPIRKELFCCEKGRALHKFGLSGEKPVLLVFGGGSGSAALNEALDACLPRILERFAVFHIRGKNSPPPEKIPTGEYVFRAFEADMGSAYAVADVVLSRAGSNTVFELSALKKKALLVPLERGSRGDQLENARYFEEKGLAFVLREDALSRLPEAIEETYSSRALEEALASSDYPSATGEIVRLIRALLEDGASE